LKDDSSTTSAPVRWDSASTPSDLTTLDASSASAGSATLPPHPGESVPTANLLLRCNAQTECSATTNRTIGQFRQHHGSAIVNSINQRCGAAFWIPFFKRAMGTQISITKRKNWLFVVELCWIKFTFSCFNNNPIRHVHVTIQG